MSMANIVQQQVSGTNYGQRHFAANGQSHSMGSQYGISNFRIQIFLLFCFSNGKYSVSNKIVGQLFVCIFVVGLIVI